MEDDKKVKILGVLGFTVNDDGELLVVTIAKDNIKCTKGNNDL